MAAPLFRFEAVLKRRIADRLVAAIERSEELCAASVGAFDRGDGFWTVEAILAERPREAVLEHLWEQAGCRGEGRGARSERWRVVRLQPDDWAAAGLDGLAPIRAGSFRVFGPHNAARFAAGGARRRDLVVDGGGAFGDGWHPSTRLALAGLEWVARTGKLGSVLDLGTGTGILAIAAARLGAQAAVAGDRDARAVAVARRNAAANAIGPRLRIVPAPGFRHPTIREGAPYGLILANILPDPLLALAEDMRSHIAPKGALVLSGLRIGEVRRVLAGYVARGFRLVRQFSEREWAALALRAGPDRPLREARP